MAHVGRHALFWVVVATIVGPLVVGALAVLVRGDRFAPSGDIAGIEMHVRDIGHRPVLLGLWSRDHWEHPGPALFYLLVAPYRLSGSHSWSLRITALAVNAAALVGILAIARRRGGTALLLATALGCAVLLHALGPDFLADVWNPYLPVLPFALVFYLCWALACGERWALPVAVAVASFCAQAHVEYVFLASPLLALGAGWLLVDEVLARRRAPSPVAWRSLPIVRVAAVSVVVLAVMWAPPLLEELRHHPGNMSRAVHYFRTSDEPVAGVGAAYHIVASQFGVPPAWVERNRPLQAFTFEPRLLYDPRVPVFLLAVAVGIALVWSSGRRAARRFAVFVVVLVAVVTASIAATFRPLFDYRLRPANLAAMLTFVAATWGAWSFVASRRRPPPRRVLVVAAVVVLAGFAVVDSVDAVRAVSSFDEDARIIRALAPRVVDRLPDRRATYVMRSSREPGWVVIGVALALDKAGVGLQVESEWGVIPGGAPHRVWHPGEPVRGIVTIADGPFLDDVLAAPGPRRLVAYWGRPSYPDRVRLAREHVALTDRLRRRGADPTRAYLRLLAVNKVLEPRAVAVFYQAGAPR